MRAKLFYGFYVRLFALDCMSDLYKNYISTELEFPQTHGIKYHFCELASCYCYVFGFIEE